MYLQDSCYVLIQLALIILCRCSLICTPVFVVKVCTAPVFAAKIQRTIQGWAAAPPPIRLRPLPDTAQFSNLICLAYPRIYNQNITKLSSFCRKKRQHSSCWRVTHPLSIVSPVSSQSYSRLFPLHRFWYEFQENLCDILSSFMNLLEVHT